MQLILFLGLCLALTRATSVEIIQNEVAKDEVEEGLEEWRTWMEEETRVEEPEEYAAEDTLRQTQCPASGQDCHDLGGTCNPSNKYVRGCDRTFYGVCNSTSCRCCVDCQTDYSKSRCYTGVRGTCRYGACPVNYYAEPFYPCITPSCSCCRYCSPTTSCKSGPNSGLCVHNTDFFLARFQFYFINTTAVCSPSTKCKCVTFCRREKSCSEVGGYCVRQEICCREGYVKFPCGCTSEDHCSCCVPKANQGKARSCMQCEPKE